MDDAPRTSWWTRNWKWFVPVGCLSLFVILGGFVVLIMSFAFGMMKQSDAYKLALARAKASPAVTEALGSPIHEGTFTSGNVNVNGPSGSAELAIPISGPKAKGTLYLEAQKSTGVWTFSKLVVEVAPSNQRIDLLARPDSPQAAPTP
ncbi:MAG TPA: cytochrome c oxidase assembly factor Coa1 family protein [Holophagaceae bacterium]|nr:cytochrome c oxidase assembly factor Coa1 family protein [Holophagaceae bacterium]